MSYRTVVRLPDEMGEHLDKLAKERGAPPAVLVRMVVMEWLHHQEQQTLESIGRPEQRA